YGPQRSGSLNRLSRVPPSEGYVSVLAVSSREGGTETTAEGHSVKAVAAVGALRTGCFFKILSWTSQNTPWS
uniref:Uncharacterized protein n=2 Tax=Pan TaxID=9596 RepID=A0A2I3SVV5_PANTR